MSHKTTTEIRQLFANRLREARMARGMSQVELARQLAERGHARDASAITRIEKASLSVRIEEAVAIADIFGVDVGLLLTPDLPPLRQQLAEEELHRASLLDAPSRGGRGGSRSGTGRKEKG